MKEINIRIEDIYLFYIINKKEDNDSNNRIRENIIYGILSNSINEEWYLKEEKWREIKKSLINTIIDTDFKIELKGGRNCNYDFIINEKKIEFKYNCSSITKYPQFLSINSNNFIKDDGYSAYFYDNYLDKIANLIKIPLPDKNSYLKHVHNNNYNSLPFFTELKANETKIKEEKKKIVIESIHKYLKENLILDISAINNYFREKEKDKYYLLFKNGKFNYDYIKKDELEIIDIKEIKNKNTLILNTKSNSYISMLLRWKNHLGILFPAWQISLMRK